MKLLAICTSHFVNQCIHGRGSYVIDAIQTSGIVTKQPFERVVCINDVKAHVILNDVKLFPGCAVVLDEPGTRIVGWLYATWNLVSPRGHRRGNEHGNKGFTLKRMYVS